MWQIKICGRPDLSHFAPQVVRRDLTCAIAVVFLGPGCGVIVVVSPFVDTSVVIVVASLIIDMVAPSWLPPVHGMVAVSIVASVSGPVPASQLPFPASAAL